MTNNQFRLSKKSQVAVFMIVALVLVVGGIVFFRVTSEESQPSEAFDTASESAPAKFSPVSKYVEDCLYSTGVEGIEAIGSQGGYVSLTDGNINKETFLPKQNPTESDAVIFSPGSDVAIPYWWHMKSANNCVGSCAFASRRPDLSGTENSIEKQLERYIDANIGNCIGNFESFKEQGYTINEISKPKSDVAIASEDVAVSLDYQIEAANQDSSSALGFFSVRIPVNLQRMYSLATKLTNMEMEHRYIEKHVLNLIAAFSGVDENQLPPVADLKFNLGPGTSWQKSQVKNRMTELLLSYIPLFQVDGALNYERNIFDNDLSQKLYDSTIIPVGDEASGLDVSFDYLDAWPAYFNLNCRGERCIPSSSSTLIQAFGIQDYKFAYDISFPVLIEVEDPLALNGKGYNFRLFLEGNIRNNQPLNADFNPLESSYEPQQSQLCDLKTSGNIRAETIDAVSRNPIEDAQILYEINDESCFVGATDAQGLSTEQYPTGIGGIITVSKEGYITKSVEFDPKPDETSSLRLELQPIYTKNIVVKKKNMVKTESGWEFVDSPIELSSKESAVMTLTRINSGYESEFSSATEYSGQQAEKSEIEIAPGDYEVDISLTLNEKIVIPAKEKCEPVKVLGVTVDKKCYTIPEINFGERSAPGLEKFPAGGFKGNVHFSKDALEGHGTIILYAVNINLANVPEASRVIEDADELGKIEQYSTTYQVALLPEFTNG